MVVTSGSRGNKEWDLLSPPSPGPVPRCFPRVLPDLALRGPLAMARGPLTGNPLQTQTDLSKEIVKKRIG